MLRRVAYVVEEYRQAAIAEEFIEGRELAVAMMGNAEVDVLPIAEDDYSYIPNPLERLLTYESKWNADSPYYQNIPSRIPAALNRRDLQTVRKAAVASFRAMGLRDLGRVDIRFRDGTPYVIDINELPDLSTEGGFWHSAQAAGIPYPEMIGRITRYALKREGWIN
jgi:D-alanine-D-alanine ligase